MKKTKLAVLVSLLAASGALMAQTAPTAPTAPTAEVKPPEPEYTLAFNVGVVTDYRYRGISQSRNDFALQGGADFTHKSGF